MEDRHGFRAELERAIESYELNRIDPRALQVVTSYGYCLRVGLDVPAIEPVLGWHRIAAAFSLLLDRVNRMSLSIETFEDRWHDVDIPSDGDFMCWDMLEKLTDIWVGQFAFTSMGFGVSFQSFFDNCRWIESILATVAESDRHKSLREPFEGVCELPWWLSDHLAKVAMETEERAVATMPPESYFDAVRSIQESRGE